METLRVRPMSVEEFENFRTHTIVEYAAVNVANGLWTHEDSIEKSTQAISTLLPDGLSTAHTLLLTALNQEGKEIGYLWIGLRRTSNPSDGAWIYDIELYEEFRGKGFGRQLLAEAESQVKSYGVEKLGLNVFGSNTIARNLYESARYQITSQQMTKEL
jgi:ribosomal protein S18 acetylase RimI-like enzyme